MTVVCCRPSRLYSALLSAWLLSTGGSSGGELGYARYSQDDPIKDPYRDPIEIL